MSKPPRAVWVGLVAAVFLIVLLIWRAGDRPEPSDAHKETLYVFGTLVEVSIRETPEDKAREAIRAIDQDFQRMHKDWHAWKPGELDTLNKAFANGEAREASPFLLPLIRQAKTLYAQSEGLFNPAIGALIGAWGFHSDELPKGSRPPLERIRELAEKRPTMDDVVIEGDMVRSTNPAVSLDFGGFAKGVALDKAVETLRAMGIQHAVVNAGGDLNTMGRAKGRPWSIGIRDPVGWGVIASVALAPDENMYTSGNYERYREHDGIRYAHILDPRTGMPVDHIVSATVIHPNGALADAASTALTVAGPDGWAEIARKMGIKFALLVDDKGTVHANPAMIERIRFEPGHPKKLTTSNPL